MVRALAAFVGLVLVGSSTPVLAQSSEGAKLFEEGRALAADHKYVEACEKFQKSLELDPAPGTKLNYGDCHEHLGHNAQAWRLFMEVSEADKTANPERAKFAKGRAEALEPKLGTLVIRVPDPSAVVSITIAGRIVPSAAEITEKVDPGDVMVEAKLLSGGPFKQTAAAKAGATIAIDLPAGGGMTEGPSIGGGGGGDSDAAQRRRSRLLYAYAAGGVGVASMVVGGVMGLVARSNYNAQFEGTPPNCMRTSPKPTCNNEGFDAQSSAVATANLGTGFFVAGAILAATGAVLFVTAPKADGDLVVTPTASPTSAGLSVVGTF